MGALTNMVQCGFSANGATGGAGVLAILGSQISTPEELRSSSSAGATALGGHLASAWCAVSPVDPLGHIPHNKLRARL